MTRLLTGCGLISLLWLSACSSEVASDAPTDGAVALDATGFDSPAGDGVSRDSLALDNGARDARVIDTPSLDTPSLDAPSLDAIAPVDLPGVDVAPPRDTGTTPPPDAPGFVVGTVPPGAPGPTNDPCDLPSTPGVRREGNTITGTDHRDVIHATGGNFIIFAGDGDDVICTAGGEDVIHAGPGNDYVDSGYGNDIVWGDNDDDIIHGRAGSDELHGGSGNDQIYGDILDDDLYGEAGDDLLVGGHGTDFLSGGPGNDYLRGDTGHDTFMGDEDRDTVSFMTAAPPLGGGLAAGDDVYDGVVVDLSARFGSGGGASELEEHGFPNAVLRAGIASGDGYREPVVDVEVIVGSAFRDRIVGIATTRAIYGGYGDDVLDGPASATLNGGPGTDRCRGVACDVAGEAPGRPSGPFVFVDDTAPDLGLVMLGGQGAGDDALTVQLVDTFALVTSARGTTLTAGAHCIHTSASLPNAVACALPRGWRYLMGYGGDGDDALTMVGVFPRDLQAHLSGGPGDDTLVGSNGPDVLFSGVSGTDTLRGRGGDDALLSESSANVQTTRGSDYRDGPDTLDAGDGNDQLVADYPCGGHFFAGGNGIDIAGFRRSSPPGLSHYEGITAQLGGRITDPAHRQTFYGRAFMPGLCALTAATHIAGDLEILEAGEGDDHLHGDDDNNTIWAWSGDDMIYGYGGDDTLWGILGDDTIYGGNGHDVILGQGGNDTLHAREESGDSDREISCGAGGGTLADRDPSDPAATGCR